MLSQAVENFVKHVYDLQARTEWVTTSALAERLAQRPASVTNMIQRLARYKVPLVEYVPYRGVRLNATGAKVALEIIRHHRLIELYLAQALGIVCTSTQKARGVTGSGGARSRSSGAGPC